MANNIKLSIVILNYNTRELLIDCVDSIIQNTKDLSYEIIVSDNGSTDGSVEAMKQFKGVYVLENGANLGFAAGNNKARKHCHGHFVLFLNSDTMVPEKTLKEAVQYLEKNNYIGALGVKTILPNGQLDKDARRSFPTPFVALTHFSGLDRVFPNSKIFSRYWYGYKSPEVIQEVDVIQGAFFMARKDVLDKVNWFSEEYFLDGEDIDLCWKIGETGHKIVYYPNVYINHLKKATKNIVERKFVGQGVEAMEIFYRKHLWSRYPKLLNWLVILGIRLIKVVRTRS